MNSGPVIIASGGANLASLRFALQRLGVEAPVTEEPEIVEAASHVILPGVGAALDAMQRLDSAGLTTLIPRLKQPVLGICLGMQLLFSGSDEDDANCLDVIDGQAHRFVQSPELPVPQMGWNQLQMTGESPLLRGVMDGGYAYFIHSYALPYGDYTLALADYGETFSAIVQQENFFGTQFHPERSSHLGAQLLANFIGL